MKFDKLDRAVDRVMSMQIAPAGCVCALTKDGETVYERCAGYADEEEKRPMTTDTVFDIWSLTKVFVCTAAMTLYEEGAFLLNDPIDYYFPKYRHMEVFERDNWAQLRRRPAKTRMLVRDAFTMATGMPLPAVFGDPRFIHPSLGLSLEVKEKLQKELGSKYTLLDEIKAMAEVPLAFDPGTHWMYGYSHELVAGLVEVCSGLRVGDYMKKKFFDPMGMTSTGYRYQEGWKERAATFYHVDADGKRTPVKESLMGNHGPDDVYEAGGGGLLSTLHDMSIFMNMLANGGIYKGEQYIGRKTIDLMRRNQLNPDQLEDFYINAQNSVYMPGYGYGLGVRTMLDTAKGFSNTSFGEFGWTGGSGTWAAVDPEERFSVVYMHQMSPNQEAVIHPRIRSAAFGCLE